MRDEQVNDTVLFMLDFADGPFFRFAFALMVFGVVRRISLAASDMIAAYLTIEDRRQFWHKVRLRVLWLTFPSIVLRQVYPGGNRAMFAYHLGLCLLSLVFRLTAILVPAFMVAHVFLWQRNLGISWRTLPAEVADVLSLVTIVAGFVLFLGRLYSPVLRRIEPPWSFLKPLLLVLPFATGVLAMHPAWSPIDYHLILLFHSLSAAVVFVLIPFARMLTCMHVTLVSVVPEARWRSAAGMSTAVLAE